MGSKEEFVDRLLRHKRQRRIFFFIFLLLLSLILVLRVFVLPYFSEPPHPSLPDILGLILDATLATGMITLVIAVLFGDKDMSRAGLAGIGIDKDLQIADEDYNGLSGAPVLGDGLVGIHSSTKTVSAAITSKHGFEPFRNAIYWRAELFPDLLS